MGEIAALGTAVCWMMTSIFFTIGGREVGSGTVNRVRLVFAVIFLSLTHLVLQGTLLPVSAGGERWFWLGLSGIVGLLIGDAFLFQAFVLIGARLSMLMMALVPVISTLLAWLFLGEMLSLIQLVAIALTVGGVAWVILERGDTAKEASGKTYALGILFALGGAAGQSIGLIMAKYGLWGDFSALSGVLMRMLVAMAILWTMTFFQGKARSSIRALKNKRALLAILGGSIVGPFLGVWLSMVAVQATQVGIASTLMALTPILILPVSHWILKERVSPRAIFGTAVALVGVTLIFWSG